MRSCFDAEILMAVCLELRIREAGFCVANLKFSMTFSFTAGSFSVEFIALDIYIDSQTVLGPDYWYRRPYVIDKSDTVLENESNHIKNLIGNLNNLF